MENYKVKCEVKLNGETLKILKEVRSEDFEQAVEIVVSSLVDTMGISAWDINNFEIG